MARLSIYTRSLPPNEFDLGTGCFRNVLTTPSVGSTPLDGVMMKEKAAPCKLEEGAILENNLCIFELGDSRTCA